MDDAAASARRATRSRSRASTARTSAEAAVSIARRFHAEARENTVARLEGSTGKSLLMPRLSSTARKATLSTSDLYRRGDARCRSPTRSAHAEYVAVDQFAGLPERVAAATGRSSNSIRRVQSRARRGGEDRRSARARAPDPRRRTPRIVNSSGSHYTDASPSRRSPTRAAFAARIACTRAARSTGPVALDGTIKRIAHYGTAARHYAGLEALETVARRPCAAPSISSAPASRRRCACPSSSNATLRRPILDDIFSAVSRRNVAAGNSWLAGRVGNQVGSDLVTVVDDGRFAGGLGTSPFDGEGVPTRRTTVFERGVCDRSSTTPITRASWGPRATGNSTGGGIGPNNFYLEPGR